MAAVLSIPPPKNDSIKWLNNNSSSSSDSSATLVDEKDDAAIVISDLTDSVDDLGKLLSSTANVEVWDPPQNRFPLVVDEDHHHVPITPKLEGLGNGVNDEEYEDGKEEEGVVYYSSRASTSSSEDSSGVDSAAGTPTSQSTDEFIWNSNSSTNLSPSTANSNSKTVATVLREKRPTSVIDDRRWSSISTRPGDAANCDCTSLAFATLRGSKSKRKIKALREKEEAYQKAPPDSPDSGVDSSSSHSSQDGGLSPAKINLNNKNNKQPNSATLILPKSPQKHSSSPLNSSRRSHLSIFLDSFMYKMFRRNKNNNGGGKNIINKNIAIITTTPTTTNNTNEKVLDNKTDIIKNGGTNYSPRWRDDPTGEASPLSRPNTTTPTALGGYPNRFNNSSSNEPIIINQSTTPKPIRSSTPTINVSQIGKSNNNFDNFELSNLTPIHDSAFTTIRTPGESKIKIDLQTIQPKPTISPYGNSPAAHHSFSSSKILPPLIPPNYSKIAGKLSNVPRFHFPTGKPVTKSENDFILSKIETIFNSRPQKVLRPKDFDEVCRKMDLPVYAKRGVYEAVCQCSRLSANDNPDISFNHFTKYWDEMIVKNHDEASRFIFTLAVAKTGVPSRAYLEKEDFHSILYDLISTYPGLNFLIDSTLFHPRYVEVVVVRIFWNVNRSWTGRITAHELRKSNFLETMHMLEDVEDINKITDYFSYEHFYVTYCKFWEIDFDHDMIISRDDMRNHCDGALTDRIIERIFSRAVTRNPPPSTTMSRGHQQRRGPVKEERIETLGFEEFVAFLLAEEDKRHPTSIEYWFRCLDLDGDGIISSYEMQLFYNDVVEKIHAKNYETLEFVDVANQLYDLVSPECGQITLRDLKRCGLAHRFFNTFINYIKYLEQESADGERASVKMNGDKELSDWEKFCAVEYEILLTETDEDVNNDSYDVVLDDEDLPETSGGSLDSNIITSLNIDNHQDF